MKCFLYHPVILVSITILSIGTLWAAMQDNMLLYLEVSQWIINDGLAAPILPSNKH